MFQQKCDDCGAEWNAAFGIVGLTIVAQPPKVCPKCQSTKIKHLAHGWKMDDGTIHPKPFKSETKETGE